MGFNYSKPLKNDPNYERRLAEFYAAEFIAEQIPKCIELNYTAVAEYVVDMLAEEEGFGDSVYTWLDDPDHFIWDIPIELEEKLKDE